MAISTVTPHASFAPTGTVEGRLKEYGLFGRLLHHRWLAAVHGPANRSPFARFFRPLRTRLKAENPPVLWTKVCSFRGTASPGRRVRKTDRVTDWKTVGFAAQHEVKPLQADTATSRQLVIVS